jgi:hypothetical protein
MSSYIDDITELPGDPLGGASGDKRRFKVEFLGKSSNPDFPFTVANEVVATQIGIMLGLHLPNVLTHTIGDETFILIQMVDRDPTMQQSPPATARVLEEYVRQNPDQVHGAIVFDLFIANNDRAFGPERRNLMLDRNGRLLLYDQGNACYYRPRPKAGIEAGIPRLDAVEANIGALFDMARKGNHYWEFLTNWELVRFWCDRIRALPEFLISNAVERIPSHLEWPTQMERDRLVGFLVHRQQYLLEHIENGRHYFPSLPAEG